MRLERDNTEIYVDFLSLGIKLLLFCLLPINLLKSQTIIYQDTWRGGITAAGGYTGHNTGSITFELDIEPLSQIKAAYLIAGANGKPDEITLTLNDKIVIFSENSITTNQFIGQSGSAYPTKNYIQNVTNLIDSNINNYTLSVPPQDINKFDRFAFYYLIVCYENLSLPKCSATISIHNQDVEGILEYDFFNLPIIDSTFDVALAFNGFTYCSVDFDGSKVYVNSNLIGVVGGSEPNSLVQGCDGVNSHFNYKNNLLSGSSNDTADEFMIGNDALAQINSYIPNYSTELLLKLEYFDLLNYEGTRSNSPVCWVLAYSTPCQPQNVTITPDTTICPNASLALAASGGIAYEWLPEVGLSCYDCPNPVFSGDSSRLYTVRIWGSDSCSVVRPVMIHVRKQPSTTFYTQTTTLCGEAQALINWQTAGNNSYALNNGVFQSTGVFNQVAAGNQLLTVRDEFGCRFDTLVAIDSYLLVNAGLLVSPTSGVAPLEIQIANQSTNFTDWSWRVNSVIQSKVNPTFQAVTSGNYEIELIAWQNDSTCADTAVQNVLVAETGFYIFGSSLVIGSSISQNAFFVYTNGKPMIDISMYDAQGRLLKTKTKIQLTEGANAIWNSSEMEAIASEVIFYKINWNTAGDSGELEGKAVVLR